MTGCAEIAVIPISTSPIFLEIMSLAVFAHFARKRANRVVFWGWMAVMATKIPFKHFQDLFNLWMESNYSRELAGYGELAEEVSIAFDSGESHDQVRAWVLEKLRALAVR